MSLLHRETPPQVPVGISDCTSPLQPEGQPKPPSRPAKQDCQVQSTHLDFNFRYTMNNNLESKKLRIAYLKFSFK